MNKITETDIKQRLASDWREVGKRFDKKTLLGIFVVGAAAFGDANSTDDIVTHLITFPTIEDLAVGCPFMKRGTLTNGESQTIYLTNFCALFDELHSKDGWLEQIFFTPYFIVNPMYQKLFAQLQINTTAATDANRWLLCKEFKENIAHQTSQLSATLTQLFRHYLQFCDGVQEKFFGSLTKTEEKALIFILECIGGEGVISISETIKASGISRPVFTSLFDKLERYKSAEIKNMGVKGTYINFYDHILSKFEIN